MQVLIIMSETIYFNKPNIPNDTVFDVLWFQSNDGITWDDLYTDSIEIALLEKLSNQYIWTSRLVDPSRYHKITGRSQSGTLSDVSYILAPKTLTPEKQLFGISVSDNANVTYSIGDKVDLVLKVDLQTADLIGDTIQVAFLDPNDNVIDTIIAERIADIYVAEYRIPLALTQRYTPQDTSITGFYYIKDRWLLSETSHVEFGITIYKQIPQPLTDNSQIIVTIRDIKDLQGHKSSEQKITFTTRLNPYYCTVQDVRDLYYQLLSPEFYDNFTIARHIQNVSSIVDIHMMPDKIHNQQHFDLARKNYVRYKAASLLIAPIVQINKESKMLDTFKIERESSDPKLVLDRIDTEVRRNQLIIWAGGKDTPFISKTFEKGVLDPNRPNVARSQIDSLGWYPWVNSTSQPVMVNLDGNDVEVRGERYISYSHITNKYFRYDKGDAGYLSGI